MLPSRIFFDNFLDDFEDNKFKKMMKCDIYEKDGNYNVVMDIPGFSKDDIKIECDNGIITISCERNEESNEDDDKKPRISHFKRRDDELPQDLHSGYGKRRLFAEPRQLRRKNLQRLHGRNILHRLLDGQPDIQKRRASL